MHLTKILSRMLARVSSFNTSMPEAPNATMTGQGHYALFHDSHARERT